MEQFPAYAILFNLHIGKFFRIAYATISSLCNNFFNFHIRIFLGFVYD